MSTKSTHSLQDRISFIHALELEPAPPQLASRLATTSSSKVEEAYVDDGSIVSFVSTVSTKARQDVLNSTLLAQLAANKAYDRQSDPMGWYGYYVDVMGVVGWPMQGFKFSKRIYGNTTFTLDRETIDYLSNRMYLSQVDIVQAAIDSLKLLQKKDDATFRMFERETHNERQGNFQISCVTETNGAVAMILSAMLLDSKELITRLFWTTYTSTNMKLSVSSQDVTLNHDIYDAVRDSVVQKLGANAVAYLKNLEI